MNITVVKKDYFRLNNKDTLALKFKYIERPLNKPLADCGPEPDCKHCTYDCNCKYCVFYIPENKTTVCYLVTSGMLFNTKECDGFFELSNIQVSEKNNESTTG
jgi:hypothetical protein